MKKTVALILIGAVLLCIFSCEAKKSKSDEELICERIETFCKAYNDGDFEGVVACMDKKMSNTIKKAADLTDSLINIFGNKTTDSFRIFSDIWGLSIGIISDGEYMTIEILKVEITSEKKALVTTNMTFSDTKTTETAYFKMVREEDGWYIGDFTTEEEN